MRNKGLITFLTIFLSLLSTYYLSFTWIDYQIQRKATIAATDEKGNIDFAKEQAYLEDTWKKPVYRLLGIEYTYEEVKDNALKLGLDLKGGMHVTLEISPAALVKGLSGDSKDPHFLAALERATKRGQNQSQVPFSKLFLTAYRELNPAGGLRAIFATAANRQRIKHNASDQDILHIIDEEILHALSRSLHILRRRIDRFGASQPNIQQLPGTGRIQVELPGVTNPERVRKLLQGVAQLRFWEVGEVGELGRELQAVNDLLVAEEKGKQPAVANTNMASTTAKEPLSHLFSCLKHGYGGLVYSKEDIPTIQQIFEREDVKALLPPNVKWLWGGISHKTADTTELVSLYPIKIQKGGKALLEGDIITNATTFFENGSSGVTMKMNSSGARAWKRITGNNIGKRIAITLDDYVYSAPQVSTEIPDGNSQISGNFSIEEAKDLANILKTGSLPAPVKIVEEAIVGPTLGKQAQQQGIFSIMVGLGLVLLFMIGYYATGGVIANLALLFNVVFILGTLAQLDASLTLPGIAGIVLTIGMSIDANVLIFERIREELQGGVVMREALRRGYQKSYSSIIDANITTFLTGAILYILGQGTVRGFATILMIGIMSSVFSAIFITRLIFMGQALRHKNVAIPFSYGARATIFKNLNFNFLKYRHLFYTISILFIGVGIYCVVQQRGLNWGVDFTGGRSYVVAFGKPVEATSLKEHLTQSFKGQGAAVKTYGGNNMLKITTSYLIEDSATTADEEVQDALIQGITKHLGMQYVANDVPLTATTFMIVNTSKVGATVAHDVQKSAQQAILLSLVMIFLYIAFRFRKWRFGLAAVISLLHDSLAVWAAFAIARAFGYTYEVDEVFIAAMLTIIGYSINDTVVVFDRIRERIGMQQHDNVLAIANRSINETMSRTLITSFTTFIAVLALFIFGGEVLKGFSFALLVGIIFGTYSSICIATPLAMDLAKGSEKKQ